MNADLRADLALHQEHYGRCTVCAEYCDCELEDFAKHMTCTHGYVPWPCDAARAGDALTDAEERIRGLLDAADALERVRDLCQYWAGRGRGGGLVPAHDVLAALDGPSATPGGDDGRVRVQETALRIMFVRLGQLEAAVERARAVCAQWPPERSRVAHDVCAQVLAALDGPSRLDGPEAPAQDGPRNPDGAPQDGRTALPGSAGDPPDSPAVSEHVYDFGYLSLPADVQRGMERAAASSRSASQRRRMALAEHGEDGHAYLSTGCFHGEHGYCASDTGSNERQETWHKKPARCKFCTAVCVCPCHAAEDDT